MDLLPLSLADWGEAPWTARGSDPFTDAIPPPSADLVVVGGGITGLSAALAASIDGGRHVVVLDRGDGGGATARSGGIVLADTVEGPVPGFERCDEILAVWVQQQAVSCDFSWTGCLELERDAALPPHPIAWTDAGPVRVAAEIRGGLIDPVKLLGALRAAAVGAGVQLIGGVAVENVGDVGREPGGDGAIVTATANAGDRDGRPAVRIRARRVIMAVDAVSRRAAGDPWPQRTATVALQSGPVAAGTLVAIGLTPPRPFYTRELPLLWGRPLPDGSLMFGRELIPLDGPRPDGAQIAEAGRRLLARVRALHPALAGLEAMRVWAGPTARRADGRPGVVPDPDVPHVVWAGGYGGHGVAQAFTVGRLAAAASCADRG